LVVCPCLGIQCRRALVPKLLPLAKGPMLLAKGPMLLAKGPMPLPKAAMLLAKAAMSLAKGPMFLARGPMPLPKGPKLLPQPTNPGLAWIAWSISWTKWNPNRPKGTSSWECA